MSIERLQLPGRHTLEVFQGNPVWEAIAALIEALRNRMDALRHKVPEPDTSIAWEDGEADEDREARG